MIPTVPGTRLHLRVYGDLGTNDLNPSTLQGAQVTQASQAITILYTHPDCAFSAAAKWDFRKRKVDYLEVDVAQEPDKIPDLLALTNGERLTPVIVENGTVTIGFKGGS